MLHKLAGTIVLIATILFCCNNPTSPSQNTNQYVVVRIIPTAADSNGFFKVINIVSYEYRTVPAILETTGTYYLPISNQPAPFDNKVVEGIFIKDTTSLYNINKDTTFQMSHILRDTTIIIYN